MHLDKGVIKKVAIIGAGPGGLAAAKYLEAEDAFSEIIIFEQRTNVGGVWNATPAIRTDKNFTIPQTRPSFIPAEPIYLNGADGSQKRLEFLSAIYDNLDTNIPQTLMKYSDHSFPRGTSLFPQHEEVLEYLERYADDVRHMIKFSTQVLDVCLIVEDENNNSDKWTVKTKDLRTVEETLSIFDAVIVANGHYNDPYVPDIPGIREWNTAYPGSISHSKFYRRPEDFKNKNVLIIGNSASGTDLAAHLAPLSTASHPLLISTRSSTASQSLPGSTTLFPPPIFLPEITSFNASSHSIVFKNGHVEKDIDALIFCTGYLYSFPFLKSLKPALLDAEPPVAEGANVEANEAERPNMTGVRVANLYQHIFHSSHPTLSFLGIPQRIVPFPLSEAQASVVARFLAGRLALPSYEAMVAWEREKLALLRRDVEEGQGGGEGKFHLLGYPADAEYLNFLYEWAVNGALSPAAAAVGLGVGDGEEMLTINRNGAAHRDRDGDRKDDNKSEKSGGGGSIVGKLPPYWGVHEKWMREKTPLIKKAAREMDPMKRREVKTLEELGFRFGEEEEEKRG